mgnify:CR=1
MDKFACPQHLGAIVTTHPNIKKGIFVFKPHILKNVECDFCWTAAEYIIREGI